MRGGDSDTSLVQKDEAGEFIKMMDFMQIEVKCRCDTDLCRRDT